MLMTHDGRRRLPRKTLEGRQEAVRTDNKRDAYTRYFVTSTEPISPTKRKKEGVKRGKLSNTRAGR